MPLFVLVFPTGGCFTRTRKVPSISFKIKISNFAINFTFEAKSNSRWRMCDFIVAGAVKVFKKMNWLILPKKSTKQKQETNTYCIFVYYPRRKSHKQIWKCLYNLKWFYLTTKVTYDFLNHPGFHVDPWFDVLPCLLVYIRVEILIQQYLRVNKDILWWPGLRTGKLFSDHKLSLPKSSFTFSHKIDKGSVDRGDCRSLFENELAHDCNSLQATVDIWEYFRCLLRSKHHWLVFHKNRKLSCRCLGCLWGWHLAYQG